VTIDPGTGGAGTLAAVLFDFSNTLFRLDGAERLLAGVPGAAPVPDRALVERVDSVWPGGRPAGGVPVDLAGGWRSRDIDPVVHRHVYGELLRRAQVPAAVADGLYERMLQPDAWQPFPDSAAAISTVRQAGLRVAVLSNIAWDIRPALARVGITARDVVVLSFEEGLVKPDAELFRTACRRLAAEPAQVLVIGDDPIADGGAAAIGCPVQLVDPLPPAQRPDGLLRALAAGLGTTGAAPASAR
jgi:FMN phosphatase YigB (HAD superfamily)